MKVVVFGASGKTGCMVVEKAKAAGHEITAFTHSDEPSGGDGVRVMKGDANDVEAVRRAVAGHDAAVDTIGGSTLWKDSGLKATTAKAIIAGLQAEGVHRLIVVSASADQAGFVCGKLLLPTMMRGVVSDKTPMEVEVDSSGPEFVVARPAQLTDDLETVA